MQPNGPARGIMGTRDGEIHRLRAWAGEGTPPGYAQREVRQVTDERRAREQVERWGDMVWRLALARTRHIQDSEDVFQEVFARFFRHEGALDSDEHRKAWLIRCTLNCTNTLLAAPWRKHLPLDEALTRAVPPEEREAYEAVLALPRPYRTAVHLYYVEGYSGAEGAALMGAKEGTVKSWLSRGRVKLAAVLKGDDEP